MRRGNLIAERVRRGMTREEVADQVSVTKQTIGNWELGKTKPDSEKALALTRLFECKLEYLLADTSDAAPGKGSIRNL